MKKRDVINIIILVAVIAFGAISFANRKYTFSDTKFLMDTIVDIKIETKDKDAEFVIDAAFEIINEYEKVLSFYDQDSELWKFNNSITNSMPLDEDLLQVFFLSEQLYHDSDSLYDITIGALSELWDFNKLHIPSEDSIKIALENVGFEKLTLEGVHLTKPEGVKINLGSLAKGYIIDKVVEYLVSEEIESGFVNAGGDMRIFGQKKPLRIGIQHPRNSRNELIGVLNIKNNAVVTSGDYARFFELDGNRYHHILNPKTGYPAEGTVSVTVVAPTALFADAYSTALFLMEPQKAIELIDRTDMLEAVIYYLEGSEIKKFESDGIKHYIN
ncbi:MAG: FAD:protein FMN transferase [Candidatus Cloacimonetes bacterium]|nr:FAD:protein FMN transferase [Candidatus Cloacimonadota bacterium]MBL7148476.1 FAD:protein FMN transferase [Candidatus Cloacimonadota bacterium]